MPNWDVLKEKALRGVIDDFRDDITSIVGTTDWTIKAGGRDSYALRVDGATQAGFNLPMLTGCCGVCVSTGAWVGSAFQGRGLGTLLNSFRIRLARALGYGLLLCTDLADNAPQEAILRKNGWLAVKQFKNPRTGHVINVHCIEL